MGPSSGGFVAGVVVKGTVNLGTQWLGLETIQNLQKGHQRGQERHVQKTF